MNLSIITLFPEYFDLLKIGVVSRAFAENSEKKDTNNTAYSKLEFINPREFSSSKYKNVDESSFGGGGMVMRADVLAKAIDKASQNKDKKKTKIIHFSPSGNLLNQNKVKELLQYENLVLVCSRYEAVDERLIESRIDEQISLGDFVLSGSEICALILIDAMARLIKGVISQKSLNEESFEILAKQNKLGILEYPHYTKPNNFEGVEVPEVLRSGNHQKIRDWREKQAVLKTWQTRKDLLEQYFDADEFEKDFQKPLDDLLKKLINKLKN